MPLVCFEIALALEAHIPSLNEVFLTEQNGRKPNLPIKYYVSFMAGNTRAYRLA